MKRYLLFTIILLFVQSSFSQTVIFMEKENGVYKIPCKINGIPMKFIFDTGASNVSISSIEAKFLFKQGLLNEEDIIGIEKYKFANGQIEEGAKIILRKIQIKDLILNDIEASVVDSQNAPLLLGQSIISKLGKIEIEGNRLIINQYNNINYDKFIGIDILNKFSDYKPGYILDRSKSDNFIPISFSNLDINENHTLKSFSFETQFFLFDIEENFVSVCLMEKVKNQLEGKEILKQLINFFSKEYSIPDFQDYRSANWQFPNYELRLSLSTDNLIQIIYGKNSVESSVNSNKELINSEGSRTLNINQSDKDLEEAARKELTEALNLDYKTKPLFDKWSLYAYTKNRTLYVSMQSSISNTRPKSLNYSDMNIIKESEYELSRKFAYNIYKYYFGEFTESDIKTISGIWDKIVFDFYFSYIDDTNSNLKRTLTSKGILEIGIPILKFKFDKYCE